MFTASNDVLWLREGYTGTSIHSLRDD